jgi:hypothetical protein
MPQADSLTNALVLIYAIPSFMLTSFICDETSEEEELDDCLEVFMDYAYQSDYLCCSLDKTTQILFSAVITLRYIITLSSLDILYSVNNRLWTLPTLGRSLNCFTGRSMSLVESLETIIVGLLKIETNEKT